eukprot:TRINITY_DN1548_c0_g2_i1.p1 TRINITY_DN1548_c0_g2~~TRINITY_DN1548_c0_g2_i1.p1  ORF type:complete len:250 (+),score=53.47 TRINITY_DN1548_c0_g2_i1:103-852(+)
MSTTELDLENQEIIEEVEEVEEENKQTEEEEETKQTEEEEKKQNEEDQQLNQKRSIGFRDSRNEVRRHPSGIEPIQQNIVATVNLGVNLDLKQLSIRARNAEYNPKRFAAVIMRIREPQTTALIFSSGKMVCTGAKTEEQCQVAVRKFVGILQKLGTRATYSGIQIQNIVSSCDVQFAIRLEALALDHRQFCSYEPELFPGLIYRMIKPKIVLLIFVSGKIVLTGAKTKDDIYNAFDNIYPVLTEFKKD